MTVQLLTPEDLVHTTAASLGFGADAPIAALIKAALRRAAFVLAPATRTVILRFATAPLAVLGVTDEAVESALEDLIVYGDILELHRLRSDPWGTPDLILRPAPPSFVKRANGDIVIVGIAGDSPSALTEDLQARLIDDGRLRRLPPIAGYDVAAHLKLIGLGVLSEQAWLRTPVIETPQAHCQRWQAALAAAPRCSPRIDGLLLLDHQRPVRFYKGRWTEPKSDHDGVYVARRPQLYGAMLWCVVELQAGKVMRLLDLQEDGDRQRPCDLAWRLQMAMDALQGTPQILRLGQHAEKGWIEVFSPLPAFAERRLALMAVKTRGERALLRFDMPRAALASEAGALRELLWLNQAEGEQDGADHSRND
jgi:hypothetical protein